MAATTAAAACPLVPQSLEQHLGKSLHVMPRSNQLIGLHTIIRDRNTSRADFVFYSERLIRLLIEAGLNLLPFEDYDVETPTGKTYHGVRFTAQICGVSIVRAGESMETGLRDVAKSVRIGKILIQRDEETTQPVLYYSRLPDDIAKRHVLLLDPMLATGGSAIAAIDVLVEKGVPADRIVFLNLIAAPEGILHLLQKYPDIKIVTSAVDEGLNEKAYILPGIGDFGDRFFGTDI